MGISLASQFRGLGRDTVLYGVSHALSKSATLILLPIYTRHLTPEEFGVLDVAFVLAALLNLGMQGELNQALMRYFHRDQARQTELLITIRRAVVVLGLAVTLLGLAAAPLLARLVSDSPDVVLLLRLVVIMAFGASLFSIAATQLRMERRIGRYTIASLASVVVSATLSIVLVVRLGWGVPGAVLGSLAGTWVAAVLSMFWTRPGGSGGFRMSVLRESLAFSLPLLPAVGAYYLRQFGDRFVILAFLPAASLGIYALGFKIAMIPGMLVEALRRSWGPLAMSVIGDPDQNAIYRHGMRLYALVLGVIGFGVATAAPELVRLFGSEAYAGSEPVIGWIVAATVVTGSGGFISLGAFVAERSSVISLTHGLGAVAALGVMALLVPVLGIEGAAIGAFAGALTTIWIMYVMSQRLLAIPYDVGRIVLLLALFVLGQTTVLRWAVGWSYPVSLGVRSATFVGFVVAASALLLRSSEWSRLRGIFVRRSRDGDRGSPRSERCSEAVTPEGR